MTATDRASHTAVLVCQGRAAANERVAPGRFADPTALTLLRETERGLVRQVREGTPPAGLKARIEYEVVRGSAEVLVPRTIAIDDAVREGPREQVVILGAGLDGRAWRMTELRDSETFEVDQPASQRDKRERAVALGDRQPHFVPVDFGRDDLAVTLEAAGHRADRPTTWVWEGVVPYLTADEVRGTLDEVAARSAPGSRLIVNYQSDSTSTLVVLRVFTTLFRRVSPWQNEPWRSTWTAEQMRDLLTGRGFRVVRDDDLLTLATALPMKLGQRGSLRNSRVAVAEKT
ncbi:class I SAM-dependent methyltransferase [Actinoplanes sp. NPDC051343]|uniref:class I SAM-dependent methyltransferase n=1 Tax=Actinoplanes sp. NPDC051343 TaxID=3363906 RepID=UPI00379F96A5